jgi:creatinine amidohydrolase
MKGTQHIWNRLRSPQIAAAAAAEAVVLVPTGATEQHGAHLPMDTDIFAASSVANRAAALVQDFPVLVANVADIGYSPGSMEHPGTLSLRLETYVAMITDVVQCIHAHGFRKIMIVNGHGGNIPALRAVAWQLTTDGYAVAIVTYWELIAAEQKRVLTGPLDQIRHACEFETSLMLHLRPDGIEMGDAVDSTSPPWNPQLEKDPFRDKGAFFPSVFRRTGPGLVGAPSFATAAKGKVLFEVAASKLAETIRVFRATDVGQ